MGLCDKKKVAQKWLKHHWGRSARHVFTENAALIAGSGTCVLHPGQECRASQQRPDLATAGLPCPAFSRMRQKGGTTASTGAPWDHPSFHTVMTEWQEYLSAREPRGFWIEEVEAFASTDARTGVSFLHRFSELCCKLGFAIRALTLNHSIWTELPRSRVFIIGVTADLGGSKAADWIVNAIQESTRYRQLSVPTPIWSIIDLAEPGEMARQRTAKDQGCFETNGS